MYIYISIHIYTHIHTHTHSHTHTHPHRDTNDLIKLVNPTELNMARTPITPTRLNKTRHSYTT